MGNAPVAGCLPLLSTVTGIDAPRISPILHNPPATYHWIPDILALAKRHGLSVGYVNNNWLELACSAEHVRELLRRAEPGCNPVYEEVLSRLNDERSYVVVADEF